MKTIIVLVFVVAQLHLSAQIIPNKTKDSNPGKNGNKSIKPLIISKNNDSIRLDFDWVVLNKEIIWLICKSKGLGRNNRLNYLTFTFENGTTLAIRSGDQTTIDTSVFKLHKSERKVLSKLKCKKLEFINAQDGNIFSTTLGANESYFKESLNSIYKITGPESSLKNDEPVNIKQEKKRPELYEKSEVSDPNLSAPISIEEPEPDYYTVVEMMPVFKGGRDSLTKFFNQNMAIPENVKEQYAGSKVYISFIVDEKGKVGDIRLMKGLEESLDKEVLRVGMNMPDWVPGWHMGNDVKVKMTIPIKIRPANVR